MSVGLTEKHTMKILKRLILAMLFVFTGSAIASSGKYQDWWWNPSQSGMGFNIGHQENTLFVMWFLYGADGKASFLQLAGNLSGDTLSGTLYRTSGPAPGPGFNPTAVQAAPVGAASIRFNSTNSAVFTYEYEGKSGSINLERYTFANVDITGTKRFAITGSTSRCQNSANNGSYADYGTLSVARSASNYNVTLQIADGGVCQSVLGLTQRGSIFSGSGIIACSSGLSGNINIPSLRMLDDQLSFEYEAQYTAGEICREVGKVTAVE